MNSHPDINAVVGPDGNEGPTEEEAEESKYQYRDFSRVPPDDGESVLDVIAHIPSNGGSSAQGGANAHSIKHQKLPIKLNAMLSDKELAHIIAWMPHGRSWRILKPKQFVKEVLPKYFDYCNYNSFIRLVNAWGFRRFSSGPDRHSYYHELFLRGLPHLHSRMRRVTGKDKKPPIDQDDEPDLYEMSRLNPLPESDEDAGPAHVASAQAAAPEPKKAPVVQPRPPVMSNSPPARAQEPGAWPSAIANSALSNSYAAALAAQITQRQPSNHHANHARSATPGWPYQRNQGMNQFNSFVNPQALSGHNDASPPPPATSHYAGTSAQAQRMNMQQILNHLDASRLSSMLHGAMMNQPPPSGHSPGAPNSTGNSGDLAMLTHGHGPKNSRGESPIMYIPVYPSTLAQLTGQKSPPSDQI
jgi:hypothetical protein